MCETGGMHWLLQKDKLRQLTPLPGPHPKKRKTNFAKVVIKTSFCTLTTWNGDQEDKTGQKDDKLGHGTTQSNNRTPLTFILCDIPCTSASFGTQRLDPQIPTAPHIRGGRSREWNYAADSGYTQLWGPAQTLQGGNPDIPVLGRFTGPLVFWSW